MRNPASSSAVSRGALDIDGVVRGTPLSVCIDGVVISACTGESISAAMCRAGLATYRITIKSSAPRGYYCGMGVCFECLVVVDGVGGQRACRTTVRDGMDIRRERT
jgi:predicted molibdopterin-dependent oxidoreductase YjgC